MGTGDDKEGRLQQRPLTAAMVGVRVMKQGVVCTISHERNMILPILLDARSLKLLVGG